MDLESGLLCTVQCTCTSVVNAGLSPKLNELSQAFWVRVLVSLPSTPRTTNLQCKQQEKPLCY